MIAAFLHSAVATLIIAVLAVDAAPGISVKVTGPGAVTDVSNLLLTVTVLNTGDQVLTLINDPQGPLSDLPTDVFTITGGSGSIPEFNGVYVKYAGVDYVAANGEDGDFTVLAPGQSKDITHDLSKAYSFEQTGEGLYKFEANNLFHYVDENKNAVAIEAISEAHDLNLSGVLSAIISGWGLRKRSSFVGCSASQQATLELAAVQAQGYAVTSLSYLNSHTSSSPRYSTWFGQFTSARYNTVKSHFNAVSGGLFNRFTYDCTCTKNDVYAYVYPNKYGYIYLCNAFWRAPLTGTDSKGGTLVHESTHFTRNGGTKDNAYGQPACRSLASSNPDAAVANADSHEYFAENNPPLA